MTTASFIGVYSSMSTVRRQSGGAPRKRYWFAWEGMHREPIVQLLDAAYQPLGEPQPISREEFDQRYRLEETIYVTPISKLEIPDEGPGVVSRTSVAESLTPEQAASAPRTEAEKEADRRFEEAANLDQDLRGEFATALVKLHRGDKASAVNVFEKLAARREGIIPAHKHMFTDFAVNLRKSRLPAVAFKFYQRALELAPEDGNAYFNMARIMFDLGDYDGTEKHLQQALNLDTEFKDARRFLDFLAKYRNRTSQKSSSNNLSKDSAPLSLD